MHATRHSKPASALPAEEVAAKLARALFARFGAGAAGRQTARRAHDLDDLTSSVETAILDLAGPNSALVSGLDPAVLPLLGTISDAVAQARGKMSEQTIGKLVEVLLASHDPAAAVRAEIDAENAAARIRFMETIPCLTSAQLADALGHGAKNKSQTASRWKAEGKAFSVPWRGREEYPAFQFRDGRPLPVIAEVLARLPRGMTPWQKAFWFVSSNPWLDGKAPHAMLAEEEAVVQAAEQEAAAVIG